MEENLTFISSYGPRFDLPQVADEIVRFMQAEPMRRYKVTIGTDSELLSGGRADFVSAIVVHRVGHGGRYFWRRQELAKFHTLLDRIIREVLISLDLAKITLLSLKKMSSIAEGPGAALAPQWDFEIHADVGERGETRAGIPGGGGGVPARKFAAIGKTGRHAATNVADRHV